jgi:(p)ppGpp synthase/HD superfamily hydrolase
MSETAVRNYFSVDYDAALIFASKAHRHQVRKGTDIPYIVHPIHVSLLLIRHGFNETLSIAALLHDVVEDCAVSLEELRQRFGDEVAELVAAVSDPKGSDGEKLPWEERKAYKLAHLRTAGPDAAALKAADAIHNARSILIDFHQVGDQVWKRFKRSPEQTLDYYDEIVALVQSKLADHSITQELAQTVAELRKSVRAN